jgi:S1-C subfamily serine protease
MKACAKNNGRVRRKPDARLVAIALAAMLAPGAPTLRAQPAPAGDRSGSAFFIGADGTLLTAAHVVDGCRTVKLEQNGSASAATIAAIDKASDVAILKAGSPGTAQPLEFRDEARVSVGEPVYVVGYPLVNALGPSASFWSGSVSGLGGLHGDPSRFRITVPLTYGFSGAAVADRGGRVIGMAADHLVGLGPGRQSEEVIGIAITAEILDRFLQRNGSAAHVTRGQPTMLRPEDVASRLLAASVLVKCSV